MNGEDIKRNKILIITYVFPPAAYVGVYRTLKYCKYLREQGWDPLVLTIRPAGITYRNEALSREIPSDVPVYRTFNIDPANWLEKRSRRKGKASGTATKNETSCSQAPALMPGIWMRLKGLLIKLLTDSPDSHVFWLPFAFFTGLRILLTEKIDVIYSTSPPHSSHIVGFLLAKCFRKPYVLDFRDPWYVTGSIQRPNKKLSWVLKWETCMKRAFVRKAARVIGASRGEMVELREEFPEITAEHFAFITNGYDPADFSGIIHSSKPRSKLTLTHAGTIYGGTAGEFFGALKQLGTEYPEVAGDIHVQLLGEIADEYLELIRLLERQGIVQNYGLQPHAMALQMVMESDVLVVLLGGDIFSASEIPAKVFEYLFAGKVIFAIARDGELAEIVQQSGLGIVVSPGSTDKVVQALRNLHVDFVAGRLARAPNQSYIRSFERAALTEKLATILDEVKRAHRDL